MINSASRKSDIQINNAGFSLVELIVVIAIMGVMTGALSLGISLMFSRNAESTAKQIDSSLSEARMLSMSKDGIYVLRIEMGSDGNAEKLVIYKDGAEEKSIRLEKKASVVCTGDYTSTSGTSFEIEFDKGNGMVKYVGDVRSAGSSVTGASGVYEIVVEAKNKTEIVTLVTGTGRHFVNK